MRLPKSFYERPLTPKEAQFATDNINIVWWYLDQQGLDRAEWFDVVIFRYLISVKRWFALPDLQKVKFVTVACNAMRSAIGNARRKSAKEPQTVSLYTLLVVSLLLPRGVLPSAGGKRYQTGSPLRAFPAPAGPGPCRAGPTG